MTSRKRPARSRRRASRIGKPASQLRPATVPCDILQDGPDAADPGRCPVCGSPDIEDQGASLAGASVSVGYDCYGCGSRFERIYALAGTHVSRVPAPETIRTTRGETRNG